MHLDHYELRSGRIINSFEFISVGPKGNITKIIQFQRMASSNFYNLAFGDKNFETEDLDHRIVTDNNDTGKVLATVVAAIFIFTAKYPDVVIYAKGSTNTKTRLYQMGINKYIDIVELDFTIAGRKGGYWQPYRKGLLYESFVVYRKESRFEI